MTMEHTGPLVCKTKLNSKLMMVWYLLLMKEAMEEGQLIFIEKWYNMDTWDPTSPHPDYQCDKLMYFLQDNLRLGMGN